MTQAPEGSGQRLSQVEFIALMAMMFASVAFSMDSMLPALPEIAETMTPEAPNRAQLVFSAFVLGMGIGTLAAGPISDAAGRKITITAGFAIYAVGALLAIFAPTLETLLAARLIQGIGAAAPRIVSTALIRDLYEGRRMAQIMSFVMMVFVVIPSVAPFLGAVLIALHGWHAIFVAFICFAAVGATWLNLRQAETLPPARRVPLRVGPLRAALAEVLSDRRVLLYIAVLTLGFAQMFALLASIQPIYDVTYDKAETFPLWFMAGGLLSIFSTILNASIVMRVGMRRIALAAYLIQTLLSVALLAWALATPGHVLPFAAFFAWTVSLILMAGLTFGNLNALALQPMGHIAGMASSVVGAVSTVVASLLGAPIGLMFNGTPVPLLAGTVVCSGLAYLLMRRSVELPATSHGRA